MYKEIVEVKIHALDMVFLPQTQTDGAAGYDLKCNLHDEYMDLEPNKVQLIDTGIRLQIPKGFHAKICNRSSMGKKGIIIPNSPGIIDSDYRGYIKVLLLNLSDQTIRIHKHERIAQLLIEQNQPIIWSLSDVLDETERGSGGFGSTGEK
jgi:dUTP pyrophosphatase